MKHLLTSATRILAAIALCAALNACAQPGPSITSGFPAYGAQAAAGGLASTSIMDY